MMKKGRNMRCVLLASMLVLVFGITVYAESLGSGKATWSGGENAAGYIYSKVTDVRKDGYRNYATVYVRNDKGQQNSKASHTVGAGTSFSAVIKATHENPLVVEKAWYAGYWTKQVTGE